MPFAWSAHYDSDQIPDLGDAPLDVQIQVYADRVRVWQFEMADALAQLEHSGFAILAVIASYFESTEKCRAGYSGDKKSYDYFAGGARRVLTPLLPPGVTEIPETVIRLLYKEVRSGMYHEMITGPRVVLQAMERGCIGWDTTGPQQRRLLYLYPAALISVLRRDFDAYIGDLSDQANVELRTAFSARFNRGHKSKPEIGAAQPAVDRC